MKDNGTPLMGLNVQIRDGIVYKAWNGPRLGPLAGAHAELTDVQRVRRVKAAVLTGTGVLALSKKNRAMSMVVFADGTVYDRKLDGNKEVAAAQRDVARFNALALNAG